MRRRTSHLPGHRRNGNGVRQRAESEPSHGGPDVTGPDGAVKARILVVDDDAGLRATLQTLLDAAGFSVLADADGKHALRTLQREDIDLVLTDLLMPETGGEELLKQMRQCFPAVPVIVMTAFATVASAVSLLHSGAADYLTKPLQLPGLLDAINRVLEESRPQRERARALGQSGQYLSGMVGRSRAMSLLAEQIPRVATSSVPVLITGETGAGKEVVALAVHRASGREPFVPVNCGAIPPGLLESELFGHVRGAFTGADRDRIGLFQAAHGGSLFLDEIAELSLTLQAKLLRVLQSGELRRVGDDESRQVNVRLIAATHRDLAAAVADGTFREDLFYRINVLHLDVPPLRDRTADIPLLAEQFLDAIAARERHPVKRLTPAALARLLACNWPGNVRQLQNVVERVAAFTDGPLIDAADLPGDILGNASPDPVLERVGHELPLADIERAHILGVLRRVGGNRCRAAEVLDMPRRTLYRRLRDYGVLHQQA